ncbi:MAG: hypothetical protein RL172_3271 [Bacteroidota bacterium]|jgi:hypothetical protein
MYGWLKEIIDWSEVWALLIPACVLLYNRQLSRLAIPLLYYVCIALVLNFLQDYFWKKRLIFSFSSVPGDNIIFYHLHSIIRFICISWFFSKLPLFFSSKIKGIIPLLFLLFVLINFIFFEPFTKFSSRLLGLEAGLLLFYCLQYFLGLMLSEEPLTIRGNHVFWMVTGISIYMVINFPVFLFYKKISLKFSEFAISIWDLHNFSYIMLCFFIARFFYVSKH